MKYRSVVATRLGGPEVLQVMENELRAPRAGEVRLKVLAASVSRPDLTVRQGRALYSGTPLGKKPPFIPGYSVVGVVDAVGPGVQAAVGRRAGALTVTGGYSEYVYWPAARMIPVPKDVDPGEAVTLILNYIVAYQALHRVVKARAGEKALIIGASGGIGSALLELGRLCGLKLYGLASRAKHPFLEQYGALPIDYHNQDFVSVMRQEEPGGLDVVLDGMMSLTSVRGGLGLLRTGGRMVSFGEPAGFGVLFRVLGIWLANRLNPRGKSFHLYGTSSYFIGDKQPYLDDWATLFRWLEEGKIRPAVMQRFPLLEAARANELLESGQVCGNLALVA